jgi:general transcription factor 3C polypeptide 1
VGTGKRAHKLSTWLNLQDETLMSEGVSLFSDPQCGDAIHLLSLVFSGELNITPCVPEEGVGELDEPEMSKKPSVCCTKQPDNINNCKRKSDEADMEDGCERAKKVKKVDARFLTRKVKGFPGVRVKVIREVAPLDYHAMCGMSEERLGSSATLSCDTENQNELCSSVIMTTTGESCWDDMKAYFSAISATNISSDVFGPVLSIIHQAGERGVSMEEISDTLGPHGTAVFCFISLVVCVFVSPFFDIMHVLFVVVVNLCCFMECT